MKHLSAIVLVLLVNLSFPFCGKALTTNNGSATSFISPGRIDEERNGTFNLSDDNINKSGTIPNCTTPPTPTITGNASICGGGSTILTSSSPTGNLWSNGETTQSITVTSAGTYTVRVISGACTSARSANFNTTIVSQDPSIYVNGSTTICSGQTVSLSSYTSLGTLCSFANERSNLTITAPTGGRFVSVNFASYGLPNGTCGNYTIGSCHAASSKTVVEGYLLGNSTGTIPAENAVFGDPCVGTVKNLAVEAVYLVNQAGSSYLWSNGATTSSVNVSPTTTTTYRCRVTVGSCVYLDSVTITVNPTPNTPTISGTPSFCVGGSTTLTSSSATGNLWSTGATTQSITVNSAGSYTVRVISNSCTSAISSAVSVTSNAIPTTPVISGASTICAGSSTSLTTTTTLGANEAYLWSDNSSSNTLSVSTAGTYSLRIRNTVTGCTSAASNAIVVTVNALPTTPTISGTTTICSGTSTVLTASSASGYLWSTGATTQTITVSTAGSYTVRTISSGCTSATSTAAVVSVTALPTTPTISGNNSFCAGGSTTLTSSAGSAYLWNTGATTQSITVNTAGSYSVRIIASGCTSATSTTITVTQSSSDPSIYVNGQTTICSGQSITLSSVSAQVTLCSQVDENQNLTLTAPAGGRFVSVNFASYGTPTGSCGAFTTSSCHATNSKTIVEGYLLGNSTGTIPATNGVFGDPCNGTFKSLAVQATYIINEPGSTYLWSNGATTANINVSPTTTTTYRCTVTTGSCVYIDSVTVTVNPTPATPTISGTTAICAGSNTTLTTTRTLGTNEAYLWSDNSSASSLSVSTAGTYSLRIRNTVTGCTSAASNAIVVTVNALPTTPNISGATAICTGSSTTLTTTRTLGSNEAYLWSDNSSASTLSVSAAGTYSLRIRNTATGCTSAASTPITVTVNALPNTATISGSTSVCAGNTTTLTTTRTLGSNEAYLWSDNSNNATLQVSGAGTYSLRIRNTSTGCTSAISNTITVSVIPNTAPTITGATSFCTGGSTVLTASASSAYIWSTGATTQSITVSSAGNYTVRSITSGCTSLTSATTTVSVNTLPTTRSITPTSPAATCGTAVTLTSSTSSGNTYQWKLNGTDIPGATSITYNAPVSGNYTVVAVTPQGCSSANLSNVVAVTVNPLPSTPAISGSTAICSGSNTTLTTTRTLGTNEAYLWSTGATTQNITVSAAGTYSLRIRNTATGCTSAASNAITVVVNTLPGNLTVTPTNPAATCGTAVTLTSSTSTGNTYQWKLNGTDIPGATSITYNAPVSGNYTVVAVTPQGCSSVNLSNVVAVTVNPLPTTPTISGATAICSGSNTALTTTITLGTNEAYLWSTGATTQNITVSAAGTYSLRVRNTATGCTSAASNSITVSVSTMPAKPTISGNSTFCAGSFTLLTSSSLTGNLWSNGETSQSIIVNTAGDYSVRVINGACTSAASNNFGVASSIPGTWMGLNTDWNNAANWCGGVPNSTTDITFPSSGTLPAITGSIATCRHLTIPAGVTLNISNGATFNLVGNLSGSGNLVGGSGSTLSLVGTTEQTIQRVNVGTLAINNNAGIVLDGNVTVSNGITLTNGIINTKAHNLILTSTATSPTETSTSYIVGNVRNNAKLVSTGAVSMLGISIAAGPDNLDTVMIERSEAVATFNGNEGIGHIWKIRAGNQPVSGRQITLTWTSRVDNGKSLARMQVYRRPDNGTEWIKVGALTDGSSRSITVTTNSFSDWTVSGEDSPLPVTWLSFTGTQTQFGNQLKWTTGSELNNQGFAVERSTDGRNFTKIGFVKGNGTIYSKQHYQFTDNQLSGGYYRLQQIDFDGKTEYSKTIKVGENNLDEAIEVYPNPATDKVNVKTSGEGIVEIVNMVGQVVVSQTANELNEINISNLAKGVYTVRFNGVSQKLVVK